MVKSIYRKNINNPKAQPKTLNILKQIHPLLAKPIDNSPIESNSWLSGFSDADANFSINIHKRSDKNSTRVQLYYRLEIKQNYHITESDGKKASFFPLMSQIGMYLGVTVHSRSRSVKDKIFHRFTVISKNKISNLQILDYFSKYPLLSSKYLDFKDWAHILDLQNSNPVTTSYLALAFAFSFAFAFAFAFVLTTKVIILTTKVRILTTKLRILTTKVIILRQK